jgi:hypothetical protein
MRRKERIVDGLCESNARVFDLNNTDVGIVTHQLW